MSIILSAEEVADIESLKNGNQKSHGEFFEKYRDEMKTVAKFRMDPRLKRRVSESDVIQEAYFKYISEIDSYLATPKIPPKVWLRKLMRRVIWRFSRDNIGRQCRDLRRECDVTALSHVNILELSASLSSIGEKLDRKQMQKQMLEIVTNMPTLDREILTLVHFEEQTIREAALELDICYEAAKKRYRRSLSRLKSAHETALKEYVS